METKKLYNNGEEITPDVEGLDSFDEFGVEPVGDTPPTTLNYHASFCAIFRTWGFIGASFDSGAYEYTENNATQYIQDYDSSWGQHFCRINGCEGYNFSYGGWTAKNWCSTSTNERAWKNGQGKPATELKQGYVIRFGGNDYNSDIEIGSLDTDVNLNDYTQNADTFAGWMAGVIQRIKSVNPRAFFFVVTTRNVGTPSARQSAVNEVIRALPNIFTNVYLIDMWQYSLNWGLVATRPYKNGGHGNAAGYFYEAILFNTLIDWVIRKNLSDFKEVQFVGTNYHRE